MSLTDNVLAEILISDTWDWCSAVGCGPFDAAITRWNIADDGRPVAILLSLSEPAVYMKAQCRFFVGTPRHTSDDLRSIALGKAVNCNLIHISEELAGRPDPFELGSWRGGIALIGTVRMREERSGKGVRNRFRRSGGGNNGS